MESYLLMGIIISFVIGVIVISIRYIKENNISLWDFIKEQFLNNQIEKNNIADDLRSLNAEKDLIIEREKSEKDNKPIDYNALKLKVEDFNYILPKTRDIFGNKSNNSSFQTQLKDKEILLERVLRDLKIDAKVIDVTIGPIYTRYIILTGINTKAKDFKGIESTIAMHFSSREVFIEIPASGKNTIGINILNKKKEVVSIREILNSKKSSQFQKNILLSLGKDMLGNPTFLNLLNENNLLISGSTGSGKSVLIHSFIASILMRYKPNEIKLILIDTKKIELTNYNGIPHLLCPVVCDPKKASLTLQKVVTEMDNRFQLFSDNEVKNITGYNDMIDKYNKKHPESPKPRMPYIVTIIDELADLMLVASKEVEDSITRITQLARAAGIHLIVATQRPSTDVITGLIKNNIPSRIAFKVFGNKESQIIIDQPGAERLLSEGDMLFSSYQSSYLKRIQGCIINDNEIKKLIDYWKSQGSAKYDEEFENVSQNTFSGNDVNIDDEAYNEVVEFAIQTGKISASLIQRRFRYGYNRAARMMDLLESRGIVGPQNGSKPREVLVKLEPNNEENRINNKL